MNSAIVLGKIDELQGESEGTGTLQSLRNAVVTGAAFEEGFQTQEMAAVTAKIDEIADSISGPFCCDDVPNWTRSLEQLIAACE